MVRNCPECGEYAYATRFKDSPLLICRNCRYYKDHILEEEGVDDIYEADDSPLHGDSIDPEYKLGSGKFSAHWRDSYPLDEEWEDDPRPPRDDK